MSQKGLKIYTDFNPEIPSILVCLPQGNCHLNTQGRGGALTCSVILTHVGCQLYPDFLTGIVPSHGLKVPYLCYSLPTQTGYLFLGNTDTHRGREKRAVSFSPLVFQAPF